MDDMISRQAAIDAVAKYATWLWEMFHEHCNVVGVADALRDVPSAQQWTPCSERLPESWNERYLVSLAWGGVGTMEYKSTGFYNYGSFSPVPIEAVTAWMPLPEPYKGE